MTKMKTLALLPLLVLCFAAHADEREWIPYKKLVGDLRMDKYYAIPAAQRDKLNLFVTVKPANPAIKPADVVLTLVDGSERKLLTPLSPEYRMTLVPNATWLADDARIMTSLPKEEKSAAGWDITTPLPDGLSWQYATVMGSVQQANGAIKTMAGMLSMFAPSVKVVVFKFASPAQLKVDSKDGSKLYTSDARHQIRLKPDAAWLKENPLVQLSQRPLEAELDSE